MTPPAREVAHDQLSRRQFLKRTAVIGGTFILGTYVSFKSWSWALAQEGATGNAAPDYVYDPNVFVKIGSDDIVTVICKHLEMGQGNATGLATLVAEELEADWSKVRFEFAPNDPTRYNNLLFGTVMGTGGSTAMAGSWEQMRRVGAAARMMFVAAAAGKWSVPESEITVERGVIRHLGAGHRATYGELAGEAMAVPVPTEVPLKAAADWKLIGKRIPRLDSEAKTVGTAVFAMDQRRPGMLTAVIKRPERFGATVVSFEATEAKQVEGVVDVVAVSNGVAVVAKDTWSAIRGRDALEVTFDETGAETRSTGEMLDEYRKLAEGPGLPAGRKGDAQAALERAATVLEAEFTFPFLAHAPMEPLNGVIEVRDDGAEIWSGSQLQSIDMFVAAQVLGMKPEQIKINTLLAGGSFGRRATPVGDWTREMAEVAKAIGGKAPVHMVWTREDDIRGGYYRPMVLHRVKAGIDREGNISGWQHRIATKPILIGTPFEQMLVHDGVDHSSVEGAADTPYGISDLAVDVHNARTPVPVLWWRSVGHTHSAQVMETMIDEIARAGNRDPVELRLFLLADKPRDAAVVRLAADKAGWNQGSLGPGRGRGIAYHFSFNTRVATVAEVSVEGTSLRVDRIVTAVDCGVAINPDIVVAQVEGATGFALSTALRNQVTMKDGVVEQSNYHDFEPTRIREMPDVEVHIVESTEPPSGMGEPGVPPLAPAIGNAIFAATGKRLRSLPFDLSLLE